MTTPPSSPFMPPPLPGWMTYDTLLHDRCGRKLSEHPHPHAPAVNCPFPERPPVSFAETPAEPRLVITDHSSAVMLCLFRTCPWTSEDVRTMPVEVQDETVARHLLAAHEPELVTLSRLAEQSELL